jgi:outer membrane protein assembly factor BamB
MAPAAGRLFFTGGFTAVGRLPRRGIAAAVLSDGRAIAAFAPSGSCAQDGHAIAVAQGRVFAGGDGCPAAAFAASDGHQLWAWTRRGNTTTSVLLAAFGRVYVGGAFTRLAGASAHGLAALDQRTGRAVRSWHPGPNSTVESLSLSGGRILVGAI